MFPAVSVSGEAACIHSGTRAIQFGSLINPTMVNYVPKDQPETQTTKRKRNPPGTPDPAAEVVALSPRTLLATNRFVCEVCKKGFQRDQNLQLHMRGHNLPWKLKQANGKQTRKRVYVCPEPTCIHHHPSRALGDLTGIKKHFCRKHGEKKWKCEKCSKVYAVQSDWKAHFKTCGTKEYQCECGTAFSRKDSFINHKVICGALFEENGILTQVTETLPVSTQPIPDTNPTSTQPPTQPPTFHFNHPPPPALNSTVFPFSSHQNYFPLMWNPLSQNSSGIIYENLQPHQFHIDPFSSYQTSLDNSQFHNMLDVGTAFVPPIPATSLLQNATNVGASGHFSSMDNLDVQAATTWQESTDDMLTRDFLGLIKQCNGVEDHGGSSNSGDHLMGMLSYTNGEYPSMMTNNYNNQARFEFDHHN